MKNGAIRKATLPFVFVVSSCATITPTEPGNLDQVILAVEPLSSAFSAGDIDSSSAFPGPLEPYINENKQTGMRSQVLNAMEAGVVAFEIGAYEYARALLNDAHSRIESVYANNEAAKAARSKFVPEANKDFKGEPYERAMVGYYLGLSEMLLGQIDEAGVSFRWGELQDTMSASETYQSDMALLNVLDGWVKQCTGDFSGASDAFGYAKQYKTALPIPEKTHNLLIIAHTGKAPIKTASGKYSEELRYTENPTPSGLGAHTITATYKGAPVALVEAEDIFFQATTLGGREVDKILAGKANFKAGAETVADVAAATAVTSLVIAQQAYLTGNDDLGGAMGGVAALSGLFALGSSMAAKATTPQADTRYWDNLPRRVFIATDRYKGSDELSLQFEGLADESIEFSSVSIKKTGTCYLAWAKDTGIPDWSDDAPGAWVSPNALVSANDQSNPIIRSTNNENLPTDAKKESIKKSRAQKVRTRKATVTPSF